MLINYIDNYMHMILRGPFGNERFGAKWYKPSSNKDYLIWFALTVDNHKNDVEEERSDHEVIGSPIPRAGENSYNMSFFVQHNCGKYIKQYCH